MSADIAFDEVAPVIPVRDLDAGLDRYRRLGFDTQAYGGAERYGYARRGKVQLHLAESGRHDSLRDGAVIYLYVSDADALRAEWKSAGVDGRITKAHDTAYGLREFAYVDPDGTAHRVGSPLDVT
jgi:catechol 2,3-dioxygenase-like lactoylglutathione lyase family enzyme